jgi:3-methyl-2-oxobutanoate hydroxymethyltransferase
MKITIKDLLSKKGSEPITCITAYDYISAHISDKAGIDLILVGDSLASAIQGMPNTLSVTVDEIIYHGKLVKRAVENAFIVADMPFGSHNTVEEGVRNAVRIVKETGVDAVKFEGASQVEIELTERLMVLGVNVMGHIGLQPQQVNFEGGYKVHGKEEGDAKLLLNNAILLERAGARLITLEGIFSDCAANITNALNIPTIGIGAGPACDGQVLVFHDLFGFTTGHVPKFVKQYLNGYELITAAAKEYISEVKEHAFPSDEYSYKRKK